MRFTANRKFIALTVILLPILLLLGNWQLERADEKRSLLHTLETRRALTPASLQQLDVEKEDIRYRRVWLRGRFDNEHNFLLDNQVRHGRVGYDVLTPLLDRSGETVLVNRGWIQALDRRDQLPEITPVEGEIQVIGTVYWPLAEVEAFQVGAVWPKVIQTLRFDQLAQELGEPLQPFTVRLADGMAALETGWPTINVQPQKHTAYAVQWFAMAAALVLLTLFASIEKTST